MSFDDANTWIEMVEAVLRHGGLPFAFVALAFVSQIVKRRARKDASQQPATRTSWSGESYKTPATKSVKSAPMMNASRPVAGTPTSIWTEAPENQDDGTLAWGSAFDDQTGEKKWGFDEGEWSSTFDKKPDQEPKITIR